MNLTNIINIKVDAWMLFTTARMTQRILLKGIEIEISTLKYFSNSTLMELLTTAIIH